MSGVALVGYSGSLVKEAVKETIVDNLARALGLHHDPHTKAIEEPEVTKVLIGQFLQPRFPLMQILNSDVRTPCRNFLHSVCTSIVSAHLFSALTHVRVFFR